MRSLNCKLRGVLRLGTSRCCSLKDLQTQIRMMYKHLQPLFGCEQRDHADMAEFVRNTPGEFRELFIQMQAAKRSQAPLKSQVTFYVLETLQRSIMSMLI